MFYLPDIKEEGSKSKEECKRSYGTWFRAHDIFTNYLKSTKYCHDAFYDDDKTDQRACQDCTQAIWKWHFPPQEGVDVETPSNGKLSGMLHQNPEVPGFLTICEMTADCMTVETPSNIK